eukprot:TRINITY_DN3620_c0_g1_i1.p1 TRINITY_DN3620_c0_g1~~TRINITY_DN3620_c0_g1_i1.p1  ORF type:complete len:130 (-),score=23.08 TRINITY_DN3620_c0_g1_i1:56-445(-)
MKLVDVHSHEDFWKQVKDSCAAGKVVFGLCTGSIVPETGKSWCGDCNVFDPILENVLHEREEDDYIVIRIYLDMFEEDALSNSFREDPKLRLKGVPSFYLMSQSGVMGKLQEATSEKAVRDFVEAAFDM